MKRGAVPERPGGDANPQTGRGHGHTEYSNELLEATYRFPFTGPQLRLVLAVVRDSYGWKRKVAVPRILNQWAEELEMPRATVHRAAAELRDLKVLEVDTETGGLALVKNYRAWGTSPLLPLELSTDGDNLGITSVSLIDVPLARYPKSGNPTGETKVSTGGKLNPASGTVIGEIKGKKERKGGASAAHPDSLGDSTADTPRTRAEAGDPERPPEEHRNFKTLGFERRDELTKQWKENVAKRACSKRCGRSRAKDDWAYCRPCTVCSKCQGKADGTRKFMTRAGRIICDGCATAS